MNSWMKRRIERSRARCDRSVTAPRPDERQEANKQTNTQAAPAPPREASS